MFQRTLYVVGGVQYGAGADAAYLLAMTVESDDFQNKKWKHRTRIPIETRKSQKVVRACTLPVFSGLLSNPISMETYQ